jgi:hypothetical protein
MEAYQAKNRSYPATIGNLSGSFLATTPTSVDINTSSAAVYMLKWIGTANCATLTGNATP